MITEQSAGFQNVWIIFTRVPVVLLSALTSITAAIVYAAAFPSAAPFILTAGIAVRRPRECKFHHYSQKQISHRDQLFTHSLQCPCRDLYDGQGKKTKSKKLQAGCRMNGTCLLCRIQQQQYRFR